MLHFPKFRKLSTGQELNFYAETYEQCSGLPVPSSYLEANHIFGIYIQNRMIGGFILGSGNQLRTIEFFAAKEAHESLYNQMEVLNSYTEICCFWIDRAFRSKTIINYFIWLSMAYALKKYGTENIIFGICSRRLAALYSATPCSVFLHSDFIKNKQTFIYVARKKGCIGGIAQIVWYKLKRLLRIVKKRHSPVVFSKAII